MCLLGMLRGYDSGLDETYCRGQYDLPSPFHFECARRLRIGFESETQRAACARFLTEAADRAVAGQIRALR